MFGGGDEIVVHIAAEIGRIVGVDGDVEAGIEHFLERVRGQIRGDAEALVGQRTDGERDTRLRQPRDQRRIVHRPDAMIDPLGAEQVERLGDVGGRPLLAGMGDTAQAEPVRLGEDIGEQGWRIADLRRIEADADQAVKPGTGGGQGAGGRFDRLVAQEAEDQPAGDAEARLALVEAGEDSLDHDFEWNAAIDMRLGSKKISAWTTLSACARSR